MEFLQTGHDDSPPPPSSPGESLGVKAIGGFQGGPAVCQLSVNAALEVATVSGAAGECQCVLSRCVLTMGQAILQLQISV